MNRKEKAVEYAVYKYKENWTPRETADYLRMSWRTLANWRAIENKGPKWIKNGKLILYPRLEVMAYKELCIGLMKVNSPRRLGGFTRSG